MTIAERIYNECMASDCPSTALFESNEPHTKNERWDEETTTYIFTDESSIDNWCGELTWSANK